MMCGGVWHDGLCIYPLCHTWSGFVGCIKEREYIEIVGFQGPLSSPMLYLRYDAHIHSQTCMYICTHALIQDVENIYTQHTPLLAQTLDAVAKV